MIYIGIVLIVVVNAPPQSDGEVAPEVDRSDPEPISGSGSGFKVYCNQCGWHNVYPTYRRSMQGLGVHKHWCRRKKFRKSPFLNL